MEIWEIHPALNHFPIAFLLGAVVLDLVGWLRKRAAGDRIATALMIAGVATGLLTAIAGIIAYYTVPAHTAAAHEKMTWHIWIQAGALVLFGLATAMRWRRNGSAPSLPVRLLGPMAAVLLITGSFLGGQLVYRGGVGVDPDLLSPELREGHHHHGDASHDHHEIEHFRQ